MTALVKTITTRANIFGCSVTPLFNEVVWNAFKWGQGNAVLKSLAKFGPTDSISPTETIAQKTLGKLVNDSLTPTAALLNKTVQKLLSDSLSPSEAIALKSLAKLLSDSEIITEAVIAKAVEKLLMLDSIVPQSAILKAAEKLLNSELLSLVTDAAVENLGDGSGFIYLYPSDTTNAGNRYIASYTSGSQVGTAYTSLPVGNGTVWS